MTTLWIVSIKGDPGSMPTLKAVRDVLRFCASDASLRDALDTVEAFKQHGFVHVGDVPENKTPDEVSKVFEHAFAAGIGLRHDLDPDTYAERLRARAMTEQGATPEEVFATAEVETAGEDELEPFSAVAYETALVLMTLTEGNPLKAAAQAHNLARVTQDVELYGEVVMVFIQVFPWLRGTLIQNGLLVENA